MDKEQLEQIEKYKNIIIQLEEKIKNQKRVLEYQNECLRIKNKYLDMFFFVWCDGGCFTRKTT